MSEHLPLLTERLELRDFVESDFEALHGWASDPEVVRFMLFGPNTRKQTEEFLKRKFAERTAEPRRSWDIAVVRRDTGRPIGSIGLRLDETMQQAELGYCYDQGVWGRGFATEAAREMMRFGFEVLNLHRIHAMVDTDNGGSICVLGKLGMRSEAKLRGNLLIHGEWRDSFGYAILGEEWRERQSLNL